MEMTLLSPLQMSLSLGDRAGEIGSDDGDRDEPAGDRSGSHSAERRGRADYGARSRPVAADTGRQVFRLLKAYRAGGPAALVSRRGKPSNRSYPAVLRSEVLALIRAHHADFGPTLACEKLTERHGIDLGVETIRRWMIAAGPWQDRRQTLDRVHEPRYRRDCVGELVQINGSEHCPGTRSRCGCEDMVSR